MPFKESSADLEARNYKQSVIHLKKDSRSRCGVHVSFGLPAEVVRRKWASRIGREACGRNMCREVPGACILEGSCKVGEERGVPVTLTLDIPVPSGGFWYGYSVPNIAPGLAFGPRHCLLSERNTNCGGTGKLKKLETWRQEGQLRQFRQHAPAVRGDEEMEAEENERQWRRNGPKYRLQASNWQMVCGEIERWSNSKALCGTQGNNLISSRIQWQVEINKWISNTRATEFEDKDIEEEEEEPTLVPNPTRAPPKIKN
ncbi:hypothetical protein K438DRAFT_1772671 [Mycena galopus ATCC 62051]|nr:hypothetical protein K438DRAFT_1772671 [Mycena galopus ATCC 62051]